MRARFQADMFVAQRLHDGVMAGGARGECGFAPGAFGVHITSPPDTEMA